MKLDENNYLYNSKILKMKKNLIPQSLLKLAHGPVSSVRYSASTVADERKLLIELKVQYDYKVVEFTHIENTSIGARIQRADGRGRDRGADETSRSGDYRIYRRILKLEKQDIIWCFTYHDYEHDHAVNIKEKKKTVTKPLGPATHWDTHGITDPRGIKY